jgi:hypothetical protein
MAVEVEGDPAESVKAEKISSDPLFGFRGSGKITFLERHLSKVFGHFILS